MKAWTTQQAAVKEQELREMFESYGEYADRWLISQTGDPDLVIWDFTPKELDAVVRWCMKRGQSNPVIAVGLDLALEGRTDIDFAVLMVGKGLQTGFELNKARVRRAHR